MGDGSATLDAAPLGRTEAGADRSSIDAGVGLPVPAPSQVATLTNRIVNGRLQPEPIEPPDAGDGKYTVVPGASAPPSGRSGEVVRYMVEVEQGLPFKPQEFAAAVHRILNDERGWGPRFERVDEGQVRFRVSLSSATLTDEQCLPLRTLGEVSCWNGQRAVINALRWGSGAKTYGDDIRSYREYLISHEVGHALGHGHESCPDPGKPAPVMVQQTKSLDGCEPNPWPSQ